MSRCILSAGSSVAVLEITRQQFNAMDLPESCRSLWAAGDECRWFRDAANRVLGVVIHTLPEDCWSYSICARDHHGAFRRVSVGSGFTSLDRATADMLIAMQGLAEDTE